jgi:hypothetical protein
MIRTNFNEKFEAALVNKIGSIVSYQITETNIINDWPGRGAIVEVIARIGGNVNPRYFKYRVNINDVDGSYEIKDSHEVYKIVKVSYEEKTPQTITDKIVNLLHSLFKDNLKPTIFHVNPEEFEYLVSAEWEFGSFYISLDVYENFNAYMHICDTNDKNDGGTGIEGNLTEKNSQQLFVETLQKYNITNTKDPKTSKPKMVEAFIPYYQVISNSKD